MAATRRGQPMQIYQDPIVYEQQPTVIDPTEAAVYHALGPLSESARNQSANFAPQYQHFGAISPIKHPGQANSPTDRTFHQPHPGQVHFPPPHHYPPQMTSPEKNLSSMPQMPMPSPHGGNVVMPSNYFVAPTLDQENMYMTAFPQSKPQYQGAEVYGQKGMLKRTLMDAAPLAPVPEQKSTSKRHKKVESLPLKPVANPLPSSQPEPVGPIELPDPSSLPSMEDDGTKPLFSYAQLIGMAILRAPNRRLTLASIYKWISDNFSFYSSTDSGWQNSIRHNLSLNKAFIKQERPKDDPGKGNYWAIKPGCEMQFLKDRPKRVSDATIFLQSLGEAVRPSTAPTVHIPAPPPPAPVKVDSSRFPDDEPSSDATIDASDPDIHGGGGRGQSGRGAESIRSSPPPADIRSSPPPELEENVGTPPPVPAFPGTVRTGTHKRRFSRVASAMGDSGYYSSIESSATRNRGNFLTSEADMTHPFKRRGRAEEEIARIRSSSYDSPSKNPPTLHPNAIGAAMTSSPFRPFDATIVPLTPPVVFKKPAKPILSVSPATNLRNHRDHVKRMLASPDKSNMQSFASSPLRLELFNPDFDVYAGVDNDFNSLINQSPAARGSPAKRTIKRPRYERAATTTGVLADVTGNSLTLSDLPPSPYKLFKADWADHAGFGSPSKFWPSPVKKPLQSKQITPTSNPDASDLMHVMSAHNVPSLQLQTEDDVLFGIELPSDSSEAGFDITQNFRKIGASTVQAIGLNPMTGVHTFSPADSTWASTGSPSKKPHMKRPAGVRPGINRTVSSTF